MLIELKAADSRSDVADLLGYKLSALTYILYKIPDTAKYKSFQIPKKSGGTRDILAPTGHLKSLQRRLASILADCRTEMESAIPKRASLSHAFRKDHSIITNARIHKNRRYVLNLDLSDFFPSINFGRVRGFFLKNNSFELKEPVATLLAQIACHNNALPQGSPCSPIISDLIAHMLDVRLAQLAKSTKCMYSRYADDLTFSTNQKFFPSQLASQPTAGAANWTLSAALVDSISRAGFSINDTKTRMQYWTSRQVVTGLTVNRKVNIRADYFRIARAKCDSLFKKGKYFRDDDPTKAITRLSPLEGALSHIYYIKDLADQRTESEKKDTPTAATALYRQFLFFKHFVQPQRPIVLCEGLTDSIYLKAALPKLKKFHPHLFDVKAGAAHSKISFFKYTSASDKILRLGGGAGGIKNFLTHYLIAMKRYKYAPLGHPVIVLIDNDDGAKDIFPYVKAKTKIDISLSSKSPFYHFAHNLYLIKTPEMGHKGTSSIEDCFAKSLLDTKLNGKSFNPASKIDPSKEFGKVVFAEKIVVPNKDTIDFTNFTPIFERILAVIADYKAPT